MTVLGIKLCDSDVAEQHQNHKAVGADGVGVPGRSATAVKSRRCLLASLKQPGATL
jgi:hypothetical protein